MDKTDKADVDIGHHKKLRVVVLFQHIPSGMLYEVEDVKTSFHISWSDGFCIYSCRSKAFLITPRSSHVQNVYRHTDM